jgi:hypothetical protein
MVYERYTEKARRSVFFARDEAIQFGSPYIESEHFLLGLLRANKTLVNTLIHTDGAVDSIRKQVERIGVHVSVLASSCHPLYLGSAWESRLGARLWPGRRNAPMKSSSSWSENGFFKIGEAVIKANFCSGFF